MKNRIDNCVLFRDKRSKPSVNEKGKTFQLDNKSKVMVSCVDIDNCVFKGTSEIRCDYFFDVALDKPKAYFVELKGSDIIHGVKQILSTVKTMKHLYSKHIIEARLITNRSVPDIRARREYIDLVKLVYESKGQTIINNKGLYSEVI